MLLVRLATKRHTLHQGFGMHALEWYIESAYSVSFEAVQLEMF